MTAARDRAIVWTIALAIALFFIALFSPGVMTNDSIAQYGQALSGRFNDWHPPVMSLLWACLNRVTQGPAGMLVFHNVLFALALGFLADGLDLPLFGRLLVLITIAFFPPIMSSLAIIWKDVGLWTSYALACILLWRFHARGWSLGAVFLLLLYGTMVRHNAWAALLPILAWTAGLRLSGRPLGWQTGLFAGMVAAMVLASGLINAALRPAHAYLWQVVPIHDLVGISVRTGDWVLPEFAIRRGVSRSEVEASYRPGYSDPLQTTIALNDDPARLRALIREWRHAICRHPWAYWRHRWSGFKRLIGVTGEQTHGPFETQTSPNSWGFSYLPGAVARIFFSAWARLRETALFRGWSYLAICLVALPAAVWRRRVAAGVVSLSGLLYGVGYLAYGTSFSFRYFYWTLVAGLLAWIWILFDRSNPSTARCNVDEELRVK
jgi:hypothetical protein